MYSIIITVSSFRFSNFVNSTFLRAADFIIKIKSVLSFLRVADFTVVVCDRCTYNFGGHHIYTLMLLSMCTAKSTVYVISFKRYTIV